MVDVRDIADNLELREDGIWASGSSRRVSFPEEGHRACLSLEEGSFWFRHRNACIVEAVRRYPPGGPVFDVGGGNGYVALGLERSGFRAVVVEPGPDGARHAKLRGLDPVICSAIEDAGFRERALPAAGLFDVLEHLEDDRGFLRRLRPLLGDGGRLYVTAPAYGALWSSEDAAAGHYRRYRVSTLAAVLRDAGFTVEYATYFFSLLPIPIFLLRSAPSRLGLRRGSDARLNRAEHDAGAARRTLAWLLRRELAAIRGGKRMRFGASCLVVARAGPKAE
jgi:SAM-dependent methyltransferase